MEPTKFKQLETTLDDKFDKWDCWRTYDKKWTVKVVQGAQDKSFLTDCLISSMSEAAEWKFLPVIPMRPTPFCGGYEPVKDGGWWRVKSGNMDAGVRVKTRREAMEFIDRQRTSSTNRIDAWDAQYAAVDIGKEGVDFMWSD